MTISLSPGSQCSPTFEQALARKKLLHKSTEAGWWAVVSLLLGLLTLYDANHGTFLRFIFSFPVSLATVIVYCVEMTIFAVLLTAFLSQAWFHMFPLVGKTPLSLSSEQFKLLRLHPNTPGFTQSPSPSSPCSPNPFTPLPGSLISPSSHPSTPHNSSTPANHSCSWLSTPSPTASPQPGPVNHRRSHFTGADSPLTDETALASYLADYMAWENSRVASNNLDDSGSVASQSVLSFWKPSAGMSAGRTLLDWSPQLKRSSYQISTPPPATNNTGNSTEVTDKAQAEILSQQLGVDPTQLVSWNENIRVWLTQTILRPLVSEIDQVNSSLPKHGVVDCKIGSAPLDRLKKVASLPQVEVHIPSLPALIPYLEVSHNQEYLVHRIRDLAETGALSRYKWNGGGDYRDSSGKQVEWTDKLPTDSEVIVHCLASYMDSRLPPSSHTLLHHSQQETKAFSGTHFYKHGEKPDVSVDHDVFALVQTGAKPTHYVIQVGSKQLDVGQGRNNMIHTILLLLHHVKTARAGMLGRVNLGLSGLNILWVLDQ